MDFEQKKALTQGVGIVLMVAFVFLLSSYVYSLETMRVKGTVLRVGIGTVEVSKTSSTPQDSRVVVLKISNNNPHGSANFFLVVDDSFGNIDKLLGKKIVGTAKVESVTVVVDLNDGNTILHEVELYHKLISYEFSDK